MTTLAAIFRFIRRAQTEERDNFKRRAAGLNTCFKMVFEIRVSGTTDVLAKLPYWFSLPTELPEQSALHFNLSKPTGYVMHQQVQHSTIVHSAHTVFICFVFISEQTATCATCSLN